MSQIKGAEVFWCVVSRTEPINQGLLSDPEFQLGLPDRLKGS
jgi:hypothetical protein